MKKIVVLVIALLPLLAIAQEQTTTRPAVHLITSAGVAIGETIPGGAVLQLSGGINMRRFFAGIGGGMDFYRFRSIPVFADLRLFAGKKEEWFVYGLGGYNMPDNINKENEWFGSAEKWKGGFYMDAGIGYRVRLGPLHRFLFSGGFSQKTLTKEFRYPLYCINPPCPESVESYKYRLNRLVAKLSWEFGR